MSGAQEFHYRLPGRIGGWRPGAHAGSSLGAGQEFVTHTSLFARPDPRRLDLRASLRDLSRDWLVRVNRQRASVPVQVVVDVSASMHFGAPRRKLEVAADFVEALGHSAFRVGDALGMAAFDAVERTELFAPAALLRGQGGVMAARLRETPRGSAGAEGLVEVAGRLAGRQALVFLLSDFHWPLALLEAALGHLAHAHLVPMVLWHPSEVEPPSREGFAPVRDLETGAGRSLWMRPALRRAWREGVTARRAELDSALAARGLRPFYLIGDFDGEAMSRYFLEDA